MMSDDEEKPKLEAVPSLAGDDEDTQEATTSTVMEDGDLEGEQNDDLADHSQQPEQLKDDSNNSMATSNVDPSALFSDTVDDANSNLESRDQENLDNASHDNSAENENGILGLNHSDQDPKQVPFGASDFAVPFPPPKTKSVLPKYVVRPGPVPPPPKYVLTEFGSQHVLDHLVWMYVFSYLSPADLAGCMRVCKTWNRWCLESRLWRLIDLNNTKLTKNHLIGIVRRQPKVLNLTDAIISRAQLVWLMPRLPHLKELILYNNTWAAVNALCSSICPLLEVLDLSWVDGVWDDCIRDLVSPPTDHRPGVDESVSRLRRCTQLNITGTNITDQAMEVIAEYMPRLAKLNLSFCPSITSAALQILSDDNAVTRTSLTKLSLCFLNKFDDDCFTFLAKFPKLHEINLSQCPLITADGCQKFQETVAKDKTFIITRDLKASLTLRVHDSG